ncbi:transposase [Leptospira santarosai]|uniref:transposase n=1 Tax=Leptospira santarosai TaxID=28183 RepID=UPI00344ECC2F
MNNTRIDHTVQVITSVQRRRRWSSMEKEQIVKETLEPGNSVSLIARKYNIAPVSFSSGGGIWKMAQAKESRMKRTWFLNPSIKSSNREFGTPSRKKD